MRGWLHLEIPVGTLLSFWARSRDLILVGSYCYFAAIIAPFSYDFLFSCVSLLYLLLLLLFTTINHLGNSKLCFIGLNCFLQQFSPDSSFGAPAPLLRVGCRGCSSRGA